MQHGMQALEFRLISAAYCVADRKIDSMSAAATCAVGTVAVS